ncbi:MAG: hypothetical protein IPN06_10960 [Burkholderiales bacterium]|nr:hypothetical protein [Burkholderiales bacterium]
MEPTRGRGRPKKEDAMSAAERARRYRKNQKAAGLIKRYVTENTDPSATEDISFWIADNKRMGNCCGSDLPTGLPKVSGRTATPRKR